MARLKTPKALDELKEKLSSMRDPKKPCISICAGTGCLAYGAADVIEPGTTGWIMEDPDDAAFVADRILDLAANREMREQMGKAARSSAESYSWDGHFAKILEIYEEVRAEKQRSLAAG